MAAVTRATAFLKRVKSKLDEEFPDIETFAGPSTHTNSFTGADEMRELRKEKKKQEQLSLKSKKKRRIALDANQEKEGVLPNCTSYIPSISKAEFRKFFAQELRKEKRERLETERLPVGADPNCNNDKKESFEEFFDRQMKKEEEEAKKKMQNQADLVKKMIALGAYVDDDEDVDNKEKFDDGIIESDEDSTSDYKVEKHTGKKKKKRKKRKLYTPVVSEDITVGLNDPMSKRGDNVFNTKVMLMETQKFFELIPKKTSSSDYFKTYAKDGGYEILREHDKEIQVTFNVKGEKIKKQMLRGDTFVKIFCEIARLYDLNGSYMMLSYKDVYVSPNETPSIICLEEDDSMDCIILEDFRDHPFRERNIICVKIQQIIPKEKLKSSKDGIIGDVYKTYIDKYDKFELLMERYSYVKDKFPLEMIQYSFKNKIINCTEYPVEVGIEAGSVINATFL